MTDIWTILKQRFGAGAPSSAGRTAAPEAWQRMAGRGVVRRFTGQPVEPELVDTQ